MEDLPIQLRDEVLHKEVKNLTVRHSFKIPLDHIDHVWRCTLIACIRIPYTVRTPLGTLISFQNMV